jgi:capsular exopolysaccharide synthesis family protein
MMQQPELESKPTDLRELLRVLRRRRGSIALTTVVVTALAVGSVMWRTPVYTSIAEVEVRPLTIDEQLQPFASDSFVNMDTEAARVTQEPVARLAAPALDLDPDSPADLAEATKDVEVAVQANTTFLEISCTKARPAEARLCADSFATVYIQDRVGNARNLYDERVKAEQERIQQANDQIELLNERLDQLSEGEDAARATIEAQIEAQSQLIVAAQTNVLSLPTASPDAAVMVRSADLPIEPSNKDLLPTAVLAAMLGLALGIGLALLRERLAEPIAGRQDLEEVLDAQVLAAVPTLPTTLYGRRPLLVTLNSPESPASQAYRGAGAALLHLAREASLKVIALTGPGQGEGKTPATGNLAVALAQSGREVIAVSCDLRNPTLHTHLNRDNEVGLTDLLMGVASVLDALQQTEVPGLFFIASGAMPDNPTDLLGSEAMGRLLAALRTRFDFVLLDAGPGLVADALFLAPHADGMIVVADAAKTSRGAVAHLRRQVESAGGFIIGGILNNWGPKHASHAYPYYLRPDQGMRTPARSVEDRAGSDTEDRAKVEWSGLSSTQRDAPRVAPTSQEEASEEEASPVGSRATDPDDHP